ncbi:MAG TPA: N-acetyltransferase [Paenibacillus sp.]|nr:hypothetical protein CA599_23140 [Paenibacillus taichungensis]HBU84216.1 N-acetyltransferase [Paenibacillus sp.]
MNPISNLSPMDMMKIQADTLYTMDDQKRLVSINEPDGVQAPALFIGITSIGQCSYFHEQLPFTLIEELGCDTKLSLDIAKLIRRVEKFKPVKSVWMGPAYVFPEKCGEWHPNVQIIDSHCSFLLAEHFPELIECLHEKTPVAAYVMEDSAVAVCCSARVSKRGAEASLYTAPGFRGHGYAVEAVKCWQHHVKKDGRIPIYSTSWDNVASQTVARKLGLIQFGVDFSITTSS